MWSTVEPEPEPTAHVRVKINPRAAALPDNLYTLRNLTPDEVADVISTRNQYNVALNNLNAAPGDIDEFRRAQYLEKRAYEIYITRIYLYALRALPRDPVGGGIPVALLNQYIALHPRQFLAPIPGGF